MSNQSTRIADLLVKLSVDPALRRRFKEDPTAFQDEAGLSEEELALLSDGSSDQIAAALGGDATANCMIMAVSDAESAS